jgi:hypothetical protein
MSENNGWPALRAALTTAEHWRQAIENAMICLETLPREGETPEEALNRLICMEQAIALEPSVSTEARALVAKGRREGMMEAAGIASDACRDATDESAADACGDVADAIRAAAGEAQP